MRVYEKKSKSRSAVENAGEYVKRARSNAVPMVYQARDRAVPVIHDMGVRSAPVVAAGAGFVAAKADDLSKRAGAAALTGKKQKPKRGSLFGKLLLISGAAGIAFVVSQKLRKDKAKSETSSFTDSKTSSPSTTPNSSVSSSDSGAASPAEAIADGNSSEHEVTVPDSPAELIDISSGSQRK